MKIAEITRYLEQLCPLSFQEDYDNCGLLVGDPDTTITGSLLCLDVTREVMNEAIEKGCNLIISHHPFLFKGLKRLTPGKLETEILTGAILNNIAIYAIHTNLDNTLEGLNAWILSLIGVENHRILSPKQGVFSKLAVFCPLEKSEEVRQTMFDAGAGHIGNYDRCSYNIQGEGTFRALDNANPYIGKKFQMHTERELRIEVICPRHLEQKIVRAMIAAHPYEEVAYDIYPLLNDAAKTGAGLIGLLKTPVPEQEFLQWLKIKLDLKVIRHSPLRGRLIKTVAICSGSGSFLIAEAIGAKADIYLTADLKYHDFFDLENRILLADIGHYESECGVKDWLYATLIEKFPNFAFLISEINTNPVHYF